MAQPGGKLLALNLATGLQRFEVVVGEPRGATELERVTDIAGTPVIFEKDVCAVSYQGRGLLRRRHRRAALEQATSSDKGVAVDQRLYSSPTTKAKLAPTAVKTAPTPGRTTSCRTAACRPLCRTAARWQWATTRVISTSCRGKMAHL
jgi:hypothetical protein